MLKEKYFKHKALRSDFEITLETLRITVVEKLSENKLQRSHSVTILLLCISFVLRGKAAEGERLYLGDSSFSSKYLWARCQLRKQDLREEVYMTNSYQVAASRQKFRRTTLSIRSGILMQSWIESRTTTCQGAKYPGSIWLAAFKRFQAIINTSIALPYTYYWEPGWLLFLETG